MSDATIMLKELRDGRPSASERLFPVVYGELRALAGSYFKGQQPSHTLQPTALVHEAYLKLIDQTSTQWTDRAHFFAVAATAMRQILIDHARAAGAAKRGGGWQRLTIDQVEEASSLDRLDVLALDEVLTKLAKVDPRQGRVVELRFFGGLSVEETAEVLSVSSRTVELDWRMAKAWLSRELATDSAAPKSPE
jgi:RNA polymerase sigma-70 factor, ECF subfamily